MYRKKYDSGKMKAGSINKIRSYCNYQPRTHKEVKEKLYGWGLWKRDVEEILVELIISGHVNEGAFAEKYVDQKLKEGKWGSVKIKQKLKEKQISIYCIDDAMKTFDKRSDIEMLHKAARKKWDSVKGVGANHFVKMRKTGNYLLQKGYESTLVWETIKKIRNQEI